MVAERCPNAVRCMDPFHVCQWATKASDEVRRETWNDARRAGQKAIAAELKGARFALWKNPEDLTDRQQGKLADIARTNTRLYRAHLLKLRPSKAAIVAQSPDTFAGGVDAESAVLRRDLNLLLREHTYFAGAAVNEALKGNTAAFEAAAGVLDTNSQDLAGAVVTE